jgi:magnesium-transporting ATPase (P-type)
MLTHLSSSLSFVFEKTEDDTLERSPRNIREHLVDFKLVLQELFLGLFIVLSSFLTIQIYLAFNTNLGFGDLFDLLNRYERHNPKFN